MNLKISLALFGVALLVANSASAQCNCSAGSPSSRSTASDLLWADYEAPGCGGCGRCGCRTGNQGCLPPLRCIIPNTLRTIGRALTCLVPCGPRSGHGCGVSCIGAGSGCSSCGIGSCGGCGPLFPRFSGYRNSGCSSCSSCSSGCDSGSMGVPDSMVNPFHDDPVPTLPTPKPVPAAPTAYRSASNNNPSFTTPKTLSRSAPVTSARSTSQPKPAARPAPIAKQASATRVAPSQHLAANSAKKESSVLKRASLEETESDSDDAYYQPTKAVARKSSSNGIPRNPLR